MTTTSRSALPAPLRRVGRAVRSVFRRIRRAVRSTSRRIRRAFRTEHLTVYRFPLPPPDELERIGAGLPTLDLVPIDDAIIDRMRAEYPTLLSDRKEELLRGRIGSTTEECLALFEGDVLVGYRHHGRGDTLNERINYLLRVAPHEVYLFDIHIFKPHRGRRLQRAAMVAGFGKLLTEGVTDAVSIISDGNHASIGSQKHFGARPVARLTYVPRFNRTIARRVREPRRRPGDTESVATA